jgi:hypothetical protein
MMTKDYPLKSNDNPARETAYSYPCPDSHVAGHDIELEIYARFMRHLRHVPNSREEIRILSSIQFTADMLDVADALVAKTLVDMGLRAPRKAFPASFLDHADGALMRTGWDVGGPSEALIELKAHWDKIGEDRFAAFRKSHALREALFEAEIAR